VQLSTLQFCGSHKSKYCFIEGENSALLVPLKREKFWLALNTSFFGSLEQKVSHVGHLKLLEKKGVTGLGTKAKS
jgi:hypothetical protein